MTNNEWHKANDHLKSFITENYVSIKRKSLESQNCNYFIKFIILNNHDISIQVEMKDGHIVYLDVSFYYKNNFTYFN